MPDRLKAAFATDPRDLRDVVRLAFPAVANSLLQTLVFLVDRIMLGHHSEAALAAMQTAGPLVWSVFSVFGAFAVGTVAVVGRAVGARDPDAATGAARASLAIAVAVGLVVAAGGVLLEGPMLDVFAGGGGPAVRAVARDYLAVALPAMPVLFVGLTTISVLQAAGDTRTPLAIGVASNLLNIAGNYVLVFGRFGVPSLGATGSAWSTAAAAALEAALGLWALARAGAPVALRARAGSAIDALGAARRVLEVAWGSWLERLVYHAGYLAFSAMVVWLGAAAMAANQAAVSVESVSFLTADGFAVAAGALAAQRLGAGQPASARRVGWIAAALCAAILGACGVVYATVPELLMRAFRDDATIVATGASALRVAALAQIPMAISVVLAQAMRGSGATREALAVSFLGALLVRLAATYAFVRWLHLGLAGVWLGSTTDWITRALLYTWRWRKGAWARARV